MDLRRVYADFIADRRLQSTTGATERHHVVPRALGGGDEPENLVDLSLADHLFAHMLLARIHGGTMLFAVGLMLNDGKYRGRVSRTWFATVREEWRAVCGQRVKGVPQSPRHLANRAAAMRGNQNTLGYKQPPEHVASRVRPAGWNHSDETRRKQSEIAKARWARNRGERHD